MATKVTYWVCDTCGKKFVRYEDVFRHELDCDRCKHCGNAYYVYGCEFNCDYRNSCNYPDFSRFVLKERE